MLVLSLKPGEQIGITDDSRYAYVLSVRSEDAGGCHERVTLTLLRKPAGCSEERSVHLGLAIDLGDADGTRVHAVRVRRHRIALGIEVGGRHVSVFRQPPGLQICPDCRNGRLELFTSVALCPRCRGTGRQGSLTISAAAQACPFQLPIRQAP